MNAASHLRLFRLLPRRASCATATALMWLCSGLAGATPDGSLQLSHPAFQLTVAPATGSFVLRAVAAAPAPVPPWSVVGQFSAGGGSGRLHAVTDPKFGPGQAIEIDRHDGSAARLLAFPSLPFVLVQATLKNSGREPQILNRIPLVTATVELAAPSAALATQGTGGLLAPDKNPGSFVWLAVAEPGSRRGVVAAWLTHDRASGVLFSRRADRGTTIEARADYGRLLLAPGAAATTESLALGGFADTRLGLESWADAVARHYAIRLPAQPTGYCTWYSDKHRGAGDEQSLPQLAAFAAEKLGPYGFDFVQIDDGWQDGDAKGPKDKKNGPHKNFTRHRATGPYPSGMKVTADRINALGLTPGIWLMPFAGTFDDPWFQDRQDWFVKRADGSPYDMPWGGTALDFTVPAVRDYLRDIATRLRHEWGYRYFKMDGLYTGLAVNPRYIHAGYKEDELGDAVFAQPDRTNIDVYRSALRLVREAAGSDVFFLGCCLAQNFRTFGASIGLVDAMRVGPDNGANFKAWLRSPTSGTRHYFLHGRIWYNDPDPLYVRAGIPFEEARTMATWTAISGQLFASSDWLPDLPPERITLLRRTMPPHGGRARPVDYWENDPATLWQVSDSRGTNRRDVVAAFNWGEAPASIRLETARLDLPPATRHAVFDFWENRFLPASTGRLDFTIPAHGCRVLALRPMLDHPFLLSTSRHVTQGMIDVRDESWEAATRTLQGRSTVIAGDGYELRIVTPDTVQGWRATAVECDAAARAAGAVATMAADGLGLRVRIDVPQTRDVTWQVRFAGTADSDRR